ncbi:glycosyltransferase [Psychromicrobium sp. YIM B11713]|uniref:glycosyltransferase n=1 Tax=Psychromicrobium sp. YIM B11713 TaxID=3145233 RepID=UPI00374FA466
MQVPRHVTMFSLHTSPLEQPGSGDAGGMNVYIRQLALGLADLGVSVEIVTIGDSPATELAPGVLVRHLDPRSLGLPGLGETNTAKKSHPLKISKEKLPELLPKLVDVLGTTGPGRTELLHSHYWISGVAALPLAASWQLPLVHSMHTMAKVKDRYRLDGQVREPSERAAGEDRIVHTATRLTANTHYEAREIEFLYHGKAERIDVIPPGVDLKVFRPGSQAAARGELGIDPQRLHVVFAGRLQRLKGAHLLIEAVALLHQRRPELELQLSVIGSRSGPEDYDLQKLAQQLGIAHLIGFESPKPPAELAQWFRSADLVAMPSSSESFGLVALEAGACGTPVLATRVGGLVEAVQDQLTGTLVDGLDPHHWSIVLERTLNDPEQLKAMGRAAAIHAAGYSWQHTAELTLESYQRALG